MRKVIGVNPVRELLFGDAKVEYIEVYGGAKGDKIKEITEIAAKKGIKVVSKQSKEENSQGIAAFCAEREQPTAGEILERLAVKEQAVVLILDCLEDPRNLGAIMRSADAFGADVIIIPEHKSVKVNETVVKTSAGAAEYIDVVEVTNITSFIKELKKIGFWVYGAEASGDKLYYEEKYPSKTCLVMGSEGKGIREKVLENCDITISIPLFGKVNSLNVSVACGILLAEISKYRRK